MCLEIAISTVSSPFLLSELTSSEQEKVASVILMNLCVWMAGKGGVLKDPRSQWVWWRGRLRRSQIQNSDYYITSYYFQTGVTFLEGHRDSQLLGRGTKWMRVTS